MALNWQSVSGGFDDQLYDVLKRMEAPKLNAVVVDGNLTIGLGFDLRTGGIEVQDAVLNRIMGAADPNANNTVLTVESAYREALRAAFSGTDAAPLNAIMQQRSVNPIYNGTAFTRRATFVFADDTEVRAVYNALLQSYLDRIPNNWPSLSLDAVQAPAFQNSRERLALASMAWNGGDDLIRKSVNLREAIRTGNRAGAWYEIRYRTNKPGSNENGIAMRRYYEAEIFGLYDQDNPATVSLDEARSVYRMYSLHTDQILAYERQYGTLGGSNDKIDDANVTYVLNGASGVQYLEASLLPSASRLIAEYAPGRTDIDARDIRVGTDILAGSVSLSDVLVAQTRTNYTLGTGVARAHLLMGGDGDDLLIGGDLSDVLVGGEGADDLRGGEGVDDYVFRAGDGVDEISERAEPSAARRRRRDQSARAAAWQARVSAVAARASGAAGRRRERAGDDDAGRRRPARHGAGHTRAAG